MKTTAQGHPIIYAVMSEWDGVFCQFLHSTHRSRKGAEEEARTQRKTQRGMPRHKRVRFVIHKRALLP